MLVPPRRASVRILAALFPAALALASPAASARAAPPPDRLAADLSANDVSLHQAIDAWRAAGDPPTAPPPGGVVRSAAYLQTQTRYFASHPGPANATIALLPGALAKEVRELTKAARDLRKLSSGKHRKLKVGVPPSLAELIGHYDEAEQRYGVGSNYLAGVHLVETKFGRVKSTSTAGARGPMQFIPSTWRIYGNGGDIQDPHDAILAAANLLHDHGAPGSYGRALHAYNPSSLYVDAVSRYARLIASDPYALYFLYCWAP